MIQQFTEQEAIEERQKYVSAFNDTMIKIWKEQITLLGVIDTGSLLGSTLPLSMSADGKFSQVSLSQTFLEYGLCQDYGMGGGRFPVAILATLDVRRSDSEGAGSAVNTMHPS